MNKLMKMSIAAIVAMVTCATLAKSHNDDDDDDNDGYYLTFSMDTEEFPEYIGGAEVLTEYLPEGIEVEWTGKKLKTPKSGSPKIKKIDGEYEVVPPSEKGEDNPCGLKLKYKKKNGKVTGSFKVYAVAENKKGTLKLKKFSGKVSGYFEAEELTVTVKKVGTFGATLE